MLGTMWSWSKEDVKAGESAGLCIGQNETNFDRYMSCWSVTKGADLKYERNRSYLVRPITLSMFSDQTLFDIPTLDAE